ncbi:phenoloxidase-activating factor 2-like [Drosophila bipectinata]|uniref:phenoloxidase-activating factor 2-like n=1 Tax=Drosophila bipectinata TaxID=42026 RepID=UPI001C8A7937|nr:phenoloxidase-activating factor 2-like [Drosophila bipectinata]
MGRPVLVSMLWLCLAAVVVQSARYRPCGGNSNNSCVPRHLCNYGEVDETSGKMVGTFRGHKIVECSSTQICCPNANITIESSKMIVPVPPQCGHFNPSGLTFYTNSSDYAQEGEFPWVVALMSLNNTYKGAGSLIADNLVLTSAFKMVGENENSLKVRAGEWDMETTTEHYAHVEGLIHQIIRHPDFSITSAAFNIAILVLDRPFQRSPHIYPICLPSQGQKFELFHCITNGWGQKNYEDTINVNVMKKVTVPVVPAQMCEEKISAALEKPFKLHESLLCAGGEKGKDTCLGDGGGPLACPLPDDHGRFVQAGVVNWGLECGIEDVPAVYTNVANMRPWIDRIMNGFAIQTDLASIDNSKASSLSNSPEPDEKKIKFLPVTRRKSQPPPVPFPNVNNN